MFYSQAVLARKGPLGKIWLAAHYEKKLNKNQIFTTDIEESIRCVLEPTAPLALRTSGLLMLGIVRIYSRKVKYLMADAQEAMWKMKLAFKTGNVDLPSGYDGPIDDLRFFGQAGSEQDFPDLENTSFFPTHMPGTGGGAGDLALLSYGEAVEDESSVDMWERNQIASGTPQSNIEVARGDRTSLLSNRGDRFSLNNNNQRQSFQQIGDISRLSAGYEDEIPAFGFDQDDFLMPGEEGDQAYFPEGGEEGFDYEPDADREGGEGYEETKGGSLSPSPEIEIAPDDGTTAHAVAEKTSSKKKKKKRLVAVIDEKVELSAKEIKKTMQDRSALLYRNPDDPLPAPSREMQMSSISNLQGLAPELEELFSSSLRVRETHSMRTSRMSKIDDPEVTRRQSRQSHEPRVGQLDDTLQVEETPYSPQDGPTFELGGGDDYYPDPEPDVDYGGSANGVGGGDETNFYEDQPDDVEERRQSRLAEIVNDPIAANSEDWNPRTRHVFEIVDDQLQRHEFITFQDLSIGISKRTAAACFLEILQLKTWNIIEVTQDRPFESIIITKVA